MSVALADPIGQIYELMGKVLASLPAVPKDRYNSAQNFNYRGVEDVLDALHPVLAQHGVFFVPSVEEHVVAPTRTTAKGGTLHVVYLRVRYRFYAPDGSWVDTVAWGEGADQGDKATNKAFTAAMKYMLLQTFAVATQDVDDADAAPVSDAVPLQREVPSEVLARHPSAQTPRNLGLPERIALRARKAGLDDDARHDVLQAAVGVRSSKEVTQAMTERVFDALDGLAQGELELRYTPTGEPQLWKVHKARQPQ